jgi:hypothetical protein
MLIVPLWGHTEPPPFPPTLSLSLLSSVVHWALCLDPPLHHTVDTLKISAD